MTTKQGMIKIIIVPNLEHLIIKRKDEMECSNPMCVHGQDNNCCNPIHSIKRYRKKGTQAMRPYIVGEDLTGISVSEEDMPELGGMIAIGADNGAKWYVSKGFFNKNYVEVYQESIEHDTQIIYN